jgi:serine/threonine-protein kinase
MVRNGRYTVLRKLADGGMAEIFLATQHGSQGFAKHVVLKRIHAAFLADEQFRNMLIDEAHISMSLAHTNIVQVLDLGQSKGRYFLVLELVDGWDLGRVLQRSGRANVVFPPALALYVVAQVCRALGYAHAKTTETGQALKIVHRDVSPQNVLLSEQGEVKLADFGIAKARRKRDQTNSGVVKGKIAFMSPEQANGHEIDARADLYALGTVLYVLTTNRRPYDGPTDLEILLRVQKGDFVPPREAHPGIHPAAAAIIERAMALDPDERYGNADEMLVDIEHVLRSVFGSPGQTELKTWLGELARLDGELPIGRASGTPVGEDEGSSGLRAGNALELEETDDEFVGDDLEPRSLAAVGGSTRTTTPITAISLRMTGSEPTSLQDLRMTETILAAEAPEAIRSTRPSRLYGVGVLLVVVGIFGAIGVGIWRAAIRNQELVAPAATGEKKLTPAAAVVTRAPPNAVAKDKERPRPLDEMDETPPEPERPRRALRDEGEPMPQLEPLTKPRVIPPAPVIGEPLVVPVEPPIENPVAPAPIETPPVEPAPAEPAPADPAPAELPGQPRPPAGEPPAIEPAAPSPTSTQTLPAADGARVTPR